MVVPQPVIRKRGVIKRRKDNREMHLFKDMNLFPPTVGLPINL
jgi:hypothetical protein